MELGWPKIPSLHPRPDRTGRGFFIHGELEGVSKTVEKGACPTARGGSSRFGAVVIAAVITSISTPASFASLAMIVRGWNLMILRPTRNAGMAGFRPLHFAWRTRLEMPSHSAASLSESMESRWNGGITGGNQKVDSFHCQSQMASALRQLSRGGL